MIRVTIQKHVNVQFKITGNVTFPQLKLHPNSINLRRISASAYQHCLITASNIGTTMLKLRFLLNEYPEFRISLSSQRQDPGIGMFKFEFIDNQLLCYCSYLEKETLKKDFKIDPS